MIIILPTDRLLNRRTVLAGVWLLLLGAEFFVLFGTTPADSDIYGHLTFGNEILKRGALPVHDIYSYTAETTDWINHEWLSEVLFALVWRPMGFEGLHWLKLSFLGLYVYLLFQLVRQVTSRTSLLKFVFLAALFGLLLYPYLLVRPQLITFLLTQLLLLVLLRYLEDATTGWLYGLPFLFVIWTNAHGGFIAGIGLVAVACVTAWVLYPNRRFNLLTAGAVSLFATVINPYGYYIYQQLFRTFSNPYTDRLINDWQSVLSPDVLLHPVILAGVFLYAGYTVLFLRSRKPRRRIFLFVLTSVCFLVGLMDARNMVFVGLVGLPALAEITPERSSPIHTLRGRELLVALVLFLTSMGIIGHFERNPDGFFPESTVRYMKSKQLSGNLAVPFNWGQYCLYHLHPSVRVSLDGRYDTVYPLRVFEDFELRAYQGTKWKEIFLRYGTDYILVPKHYPLHDRITDSPAVTKLHTGRQAALYRLKSPGKKTSN